VPRRKAEIRPFRSDDEPLLFGLARMAFGDEPGWDDRRTLSVLETEQVFVAEIGGLPAGFVALDASDDAARIDELFVTPDHEGEGVGTQLLEWAEGYAISIGALRLQVVVEAGNVRAQRLYRGRGFVPAGDELLELVLPGQ
jgi:ribosomal protein S18 acetylase RimI-like enzyme